MSRITARNELWNLSWSELFELFDLCDLSFKAAHDIAARKLLKVSRALAIMTKEEFAACNTLKDVVVIAIAH